MKALSGISKGEPFPAQPSKLHHSTAMAITQDTFTNGEKTANSHAATMRAFACHGTPLRGLMSTPRSITFEGRFGRMFPNHLMAAKYGATDEQSRKALKELGNEMTSTFDEPKDGFDGEESGIPALYTYFGQFIDHDLTFDPVSTLIRHSDPDGLTDFRTPALDLDNVYGRGPDDQPYLYNGNSFILGAALDNGAPDLPRNNATPARAIIGDPRNDENSIVSQFQALMLRFHNRVVNENPGLDFTSVQNIVRWHYQWVVLNDFLPKIISPSVVNALKTNDEYDRRKIKFFQWKKKPFMPVEFSVAAYRLGHSMIRPGYRLNDEKLLPIFPVPASVQGAGSGELSHEGLTGFEAMSKDRGIDWGRFIDIGPPRAYGASPDEPAGQPPTEEMKKRLQFAYRLDASIVTPLSVLPKSVAADDPPSLAQRNLLRGFELGLPNGQSVARTMGVKPLRDDQIFINKAQDADKPLQPERSIAGNPKFAAFRDNCPLWTYILAEAAFSVTTADKRIEVPVLPAGTKVTTPQLGEVGGRIVAEVFLGLVFGDRSSYLSAAPGWTPTIRGVGTKFALRDIVAYALGE